MGVYCDWLAQRGLTSPIATYAGWRLRVLCGVCEFSANSAGTRKRAFGREGCELGEEDDPITQACWRQVAVLTHASRGEYAEVETLAREAVARTERSFGEGDLVSKKHRLIERDREDE